MRFHIIAALLAAGLAAAAPVSDTAAPEAHVEEKRGFTPLFCGGFCISLIENPAAYAACVAACTATGSEGFDPAEFMKNSTSTA